MSAIRNNGTCKTYSAMKLSPLEMGAVSTLKKNDKRKAKSFTPRIWRVHVSRVDGAGFWTRSQAHRHSNGYPDDDSGSNGICGLFVML